MVNVCVTSAVLEQSTELSAVWGFLLSGGLTGGGTFAVCVAAKVLLQCEIFQPPFINVRLRPRLTLPL